ncbi:MAG: DUF3078 domain-containing protein [Bacteroidales bacterium]|jgi:hypothetical protein|nr:DUF3078 domain-containing protein [Bacteroidales bacterium]
MKSRTVSIFVIMIFVCSFATGQVTDAEKKLKTLNTDTIMGWKKGGVFALNLAQTSLSNWAAGGQNSFAMNGIFSAFANYKQGKSAWDNTLDLGYGILKQGKDGIAMKTDDKIDFLSKYGREAFKNIYYAALLNFRTQMRPGYKYPDTDNKISDIFSPAYLLLAAGIDYKPSPYFTAFVAPLTGKFTFVNDPALSAAGAFGVTPGEKSRSELGGYLRAAYSKNDFKGEFLKNVSFTTKIDLFSNYRDNPQNIDVMWENLIALKVNKYINVNFNTVLIYDDNIKVPVDRNGNGEFESNEAPGPRTQFKELFGVGFSHNF